MSDRVPLNESAQRRRITAPEPDAGSPAESPMPRNAKLRRPFGSREQKLAYAVREGFHRHWFNDEPGRIQRALDAGYAHVQAGGANVATVVGVARGGGPLTVYLMEIPSVWYNEDMAALEADHRDLRAQIEAGRAPNGPGGRDAQYVPGNRGIVIREDRR